MRPTLRDPLTALALLLLLSPLLALATAAPARAAGPADLVINEIAPVAGDGDWVEIHNNSDAPVSLDGGTLSAIPFRGEAVVVDLEGVIPGHGFQVVPLRLNVGDSLSLRFGDIEIDRFRAPGEVVDVSYGRCPDGSETWARTYRPTPGSSNVCNFVLVNEVDPAPDSGSAWVELINTGDHPQDLRQTWIGNGEWTIDLSGTLAPGETRRFDFSPTEFRGVSYLSIPGREFDRFDWGGAVPPATSWGRCPNGAGRPLDNALVVTETETPGAPNDCGVEETSTVLEIDRTTVTYGDRVELTATVAAADGTGTPTGAVNFIEGDTVLGTVDLDGGGTAVLTLSNLSAGGHRLRAEYAGDSSFGGSSAEPVTVEVAQAPTSIVATSAIRLLPVGVGQLRATVTSRSEPLAGVPVEFRVGGTTMCRSTTDAAGVATCNASAHVVAILLAGGYTASYAGDQNHEAAAARGRAL